MATFTVTSLLNGWVFADFGFNTGGAMLALGSCMGEVSGCSLSGLGNNSEDGWGKFDYSLTTGVHGGSGGDCSGNPGHPSGGCTFSFTLSGSSLSLSTFEHASSGGAGSGFFAGHMVTSNNSGYAGDSVPAPLPEPATLMVLTPGLLTAAGLILRRSLSF